MEALSAVEFFSKAFDWFASLSSKLPKIDFKTYFIVVVALLLGVGLIIALTFFGTYRFKLTRACRKIIRYLSGVEFIDDDNVSDFTAQCFSAKAPSVLRDSWVQYLGVRFGYPSDIVSEQNVYDKEVKRVREVRANVYIAIALVLIAVFSFWGYGTLDGKDMGVIFLASLLLSGVVYLVLVIINKVQSKTCLNTLSEMQEDLDAKVILQVEKSFATDSSPLGDLAAIVDEIVARNTAKDIGFDNGDVETPIEMLIAQSSLGVQEEPKAEESVETFVDEMMQESFDGLELEPEEESAPQENEPAQGTEEEQVVEEDKSDEPALEEAVEDVEEVSSETAIEEPVQEEVDKADDEVEAIDGEVSEDTDASEAIDGEVEEVPEQENEQAVEDVEEVEEVENDVKAEEQGQKALSAPAEDDSKDNATTDAQEEVVDNKAEEATEEPEKKALTTNDAQDDATEDNKKKEAAGDLEPKVIVVEEAVDDDENVKPAKLVKLPNLIDYMLAVKPSRKVMMQIATLLLSAYSKFKDSEEDRKIVIDCMKKVMFALQSNR